MNRSSDTDDLINLSREESPERGSSAADGPEDGGTNPFAPPPPKARIFHEINGDGLLKDASDPVGWIESTPHKRTPYDQNYDYETPYRRRKGKYPWATWLNHPITVALIAATLVFGYFALPYGSPLRWLILFTVILIVPYWTYNWPRYRYRYNMDWESNAEPTGCLWPYWYWWRWW